MTGWRDTQSWIAVGEASGSAMKENDDGEGRIMPASK